MDGIKRADLLQRYEKVRKRNDELTKEMSKYHRLDPDRFTLHQEAIKQALKEALQEALQEGLKEALKEALKEGLRKFKEEEDKY